MVVEAPSQKKSIPVITGSGRRVPRLLHSLNLHSRYCTTVRLTVPGADTVMEEPEDPSDHCRTGNRAQPVKWLKCRNRIPGCRLLPVAIRDLRNRNRSVARTAVPVGNRQAVICFTTLIEGWELPVDQRYSLKAPSALRVVVPSVQNSRIPVIPATGSGFSTTVTDWLLEQPLLSVTTTDTSPGADTMLEVSVEPVLHW